MTQGEQSNNNHFEIEEDPAIPEESLCDKDPNLRWKSSIEQRTLFLLCFITFVDVLCYGILFPVLPAYALSLGGNAFWIGLILACYAVFGFIGTGIWGTLSDKYGRKPFLLLGLFGLTAGQVVIALAPSLWMLALGRCISGFFGGTEGVTNAYVADLTSTADRTKHMGRLGAAAGIGFMVGTAFGGLLGHWLGFAGVNLLSSGMIGLTFIASIFLLKEPPSRETRPKTAFSSKELAKLALTPMVGIEGTIGVLCAEEYNLEEIYIGVLMTVLGLVYLLVQLMAGKIAELFGEKKCCALSYGVCIFCTAVVPFMPNYWTLFIPGIIFEFFGSIGDFALPGLLSISVPETHQGFIFGVFKSVQMVARATAPLVMGALYDRKFYLPYVSSGGLFAVTFVLSLILFPLSKREMKYTQLSEIESGESLLRQENGVHETVDLSG